MFRLIGYLVVAILNYLGGGYTEDRPGPVKEERSICCEWNAGERIPARYAGKGDIIWPLPIINM